MAKLKTEKPVFERTISEVLFEQIRFLWRYNDSIEIQNLTGFSRPIVDRALNFGHIRDKTLERAIISYYEERAELHNAAEIKINNLLIHKNKK